VYGASYGASLDDREMCVSPGTMAQFTFSRRLSEEDKTGRPHLDSITEQDFRDYDVDMEGLNIEEDEDEVQVSENAIREYKCLKPCSMKEALDKEVNIVDSRQASHVLVRPLLLEQNKNKRRRVRRSLVKPGSLTMRCLSSLKHDPPKDWFLPVNHFMKDYVKSHSYWFDFSTPPVRFPLNSNLKGTFVFEKRLTLNFSFLQGKYLFQ